MTVLAHIRTRQASWGRRVLALFAFAWLNLALQPCVMAVEAETEHDCPHCPPQVMAHHEMPGATSTPCASATDCDSVADFYFDAREATTKIKPPADHQIALLPHALGAPAPPPPCAIERHRVRAAHGGAPPPLHLLNCVFLN